MNCSFKNYKVFFFIYFNAFCFQFHLVRYQDYDPLFSFLCLPDVSFSILLFLTLLNLFVLGVSCILHSVGFCFISQSENPFLSIGELSPFTSIDMIKMFGLSSIVLFYFYVFCIYSFFIIQWVLSAFLFHCLTLYYTFYTISPFFGLKLVSYIEQY